jgi:hypothetical protein
MFISSNLFMNSFERYKKIDSEKKERYRHRGINGVEAGLGLGFATFFLAISIFFLVLELLLLLYSINIALKCTQPGTERIMHVTLAMFFTIPYAMLSIFFNKCAITNLQSSPGFLPVF